MGAKSKGNPDPRQGDLLAWQPSDPVQRYPEVQVRATTLRARIARAVATTLKETDTERSDVARLMSDWLDEKVTKAMLDAYASEARESHSIPYLRLIALVHVTGDARPLQLAAEQFGYSVIADRHLGWVRVGQIADHREEVEREFEAARRRAREQAEDVS